MSSKIIQIIPSPPNMWAKWGATEDGEETGYSHVVCLALMEDEDGVNYVAPMVCFDDGDIDDAMDCSNFEGVVFSKEPAAESKPIWHNAKTDPPKTTGVYYGKKDDTNSMWLCRYGDGKWVMDAYQEQETKIIQWAEYTAFKEAPDGN